jgi:thiamine biosynthesis lipoprotein
MDPRTGRPHDSALASVTVVAPDCRTADGWATAVMVLGPEDGLAALEDRPELEGLLIVSTPEGFRQQATSGMERLLVTEDPGR